MPDFLTANVGVGSTWQESTSSRQHTRKGDQSASSQEKAEAKCWLGVVATG